MNITHKILIFLIALLSVAGVSRAANTLYEFYRERGENLPSIEQRAPLAVEAGIVGTEDQYQNLLNPHEVTTLQNVALLKHLQGGDTDDVSLGATPVTATGWTLSEQHNTSVTTIKLSHVNDIRSNAVATSSLPYFVYLAIEPEVSSKFEIVKCPRSGFDQVNKWFTNCTRGLAFSGTSEASVSANIKTHPSGASSNMTNVGQFFNLFGGIYDQNTWQNHNIFATSTPGTSYLQVATSTAYDAYMYFFGTSASSPRIYASASSSKLYICHNSTNCYDPATAASGIEAQSPFYLDGSQLKMATGSPAYWWGLDTSVATPFPLKIATTTISSGTASGTGLDDHWNARHNATTTMPALKTGNATTTKLTVGTSNFVGNGVAYIGGNATTTGSMDVQSLCFSGTGCATSISDRLKVATTSAGQLTTGTATTETTLFSQSINGGLMGTKGYIRVTLFGLCDGNGGSNCVINIKYGGTTFCGDNMGSDADTKVYAECTIINDSSASVQTANGYFIRRGSTSVTPTMPVAVTGTINSAIAQTLLISGDVDNAGDSVLIRGVTVEIIKHD